MTEFERNCYGMTTEDIRDQYINGFTGRHAGPEIVVIGMLSDCQHMVEHNFNPNDIRKMLNRAKFILSEMMKDKQSA